MTPVQFETLRDEFLTKESAILEWKRGEYTSGEDRLQNFREVAGFLGQRPADGGRAMKKEQLKQLRHLKNEIKLLQKQIAELDYPVTSDVVKGSMTEFPYIEQHIRITGIDEEGYKRRLNRLKRKLKRKLDELMDLVEEATEYINGIDDSLIRQILSLRYVNGLTWEQVAASIGGGNTADSVRKAAERFLEK